MGRESFKGRNMEEEMKEKAKLSPGETTVARETDGLTGDEAEDALNAKMKLPPRKRFVKIEDVPSTMSVEDQLEQRKLEKEEDERLAQVEEIKKHIHNEDYEESNSGITGVEISEEPSRAIKVNGMDISSAVSGSKSHIKENWFSTKADKTAKVRGGEHDSTRVTKISKARRAEHKKSPKK